MKACEKEEEEEEEEEQEEEEEEEDDEEVHASPELGLLASFGCLSPNAFRFCQARAEFLPSDERYLALCSACPRDSSAVWFLSCFTSKLFLNNDSSILPSGGKVLHLI